MKKSILFALGSYGRGLIIVIGLLVIGIVLVLLEIIYQQEETRLVDRMQSEIKLELIASTAYLKENIYQHRIRVSTVSQLSSVVAAMSEANSSFMDSVPLVPPTFWQALASNDLRHFLENDPEAYQIRTISKINNRFLETIRFERIDNEIIETPQALLQDKTHRTYMQEIAALETGQAYISEIDLNREFGVIEHPIRPTIRISAEIPAQNTNPAYLVANFDAITAFQGIIRLISPEYDVYLLNEKHQFLIHADKNIAFDFEFGQGTVYEHLFDIWPENKQSIKINYRSNGMSYGHIQRLDLTIGDDHYPRTFHLLIGIPNAALAAAMKAQVPSILGIGSILTAVFIFLAILFVKSLKSQLALAAEFQTMAAVVSSTDDAVVAIDTNYRISVVNTAAQQLFGSHEESLLDQKIQNTRIADILPDDFKATGNAQQGISRTSTLSQNDGSLLYLSATISPILDPNGRRLGTSMVIRDTTQLADAEAEVRMLNETLEGKVLDRTREAQRLREIAEAANKAKSRFLANMSHEIRTPLNAVSGMMTLLSRSELPRKQHEYALRASQSLSSLAHIINDILDLSKVEADKIELEKATFSLDEVAGYLGNLCASNLPTDQVEVIFRIDPNIPPYLTGDKARLQQILVNLLSNAMKFTREGEITLNITPTNQSDIQNDNQIALKFEVSDTGMGIPADKLDSVFSAFTQAEESTTRQFGGTGLGLTISQRLVNLMGGELAVSSELGEGSSFSFQIEFGIDKHAVEHRGLVPGDLKNLKILVIDNNTTVGMVICDIIRRAKWEAIYEPYSVSGIERLVAAANQANAFDVVLIDLHMQVFDGYDVAEKIRELRSRIEQPVIFLMSVRQDPDLIDEDRITSLGIHGMLNKPITASSLIDAVADAVRAKGSNQPRKPTKKPVDKHLQGLHLLLVEDNTTNQQIATELLQDEGATITIANNGLEAVEKINIEGLKVDLILMDIQMPVLDGIEATLMIKGQRGNEQIPIIALTADVMPDEKQKAIAVGMSGVVYKPFDLDELVNEILTQTQQAKTQLMLTAEFSNSENQCLPKEFEALASKNEIDLEPVFIKFSKKTKVLQWALTEFSDSADKLLQSATTQLNEEVPHTDIRREFHSLKSHLKTLGLEQLADIANSLEHQLSEQDYDRDLAIELTKRIKTQFELKRPILKTLADMLSDQIHAGHS